jgi:hypothetical protein
MKAMSLRRFLSDLGIEPFAWFVALLVLGISTPHPFADFTLCPLSNIGITDCPGCGLGRSISYALHGQMSASLQAHWLGIPAVVILCFRVGSLVRTTLRRQQLSNSPTI